MLLSSRVGTSAYDLLLQPLLLQRDDVALVEAAGPFTSSSLSSLAGHSNQATVAGLLLSEVADHCQLLLAHEALACRPSHIATGDAGSAAPCTKSSINEAYYNLDKVFA